MAVRLFSVLILTLAACGACPVCAAVSITKVLSGARTGNLPPVPLDAPRAPLQLSFSHQPTVFHFQGDPSDGHTPVRLRYKLEGVDPIWKDLPSRMAVLLRLCDEKDQVLAGDALSVNGESPLWNGNPEKAPLAPFRLHFTAPQPAARVVICFVADGQPTTTGQLVADGITLHRLPADGSPATMVSLDCNTRLDSDARHGNPNNWKRDGMSPGIAQLLRRDMPPSLALLLNDADPAKAGAWRSRSIAMPLVQGDQLALEWNMAYSIGSSGPGTASYTGLKPGKYWFRVASVSANGLPTGVESSLPVTVLPPLTRRPEFWAVLLTFFSGLLLVSVRRVTKRRLLQKLEAVERQRLLESERARIARDIHDDLGATLAQIAMLSEIARTDAAATPPESRQHFNDIFSLAFESTRKLNEIIWAINPANDTLEHFVRYLCRFAEHHLQLSGVRFRLDAPETMPPHTLSSIQRHNLFLAAKEALHNAVKHAAATEVALRIRLEGDRLLVCIEDNGSGFVDAPELSLGHGSANMKHRMEQIKGTYQRTSTVGAGTAVELSLPL